MARKSYAPLPKFTLEQLKVIKAEDDWNGHKLPVLCWPLSKMRREAKVAGLPRLICLMLPKFWAHRWIKYVRAKAVKTPDNADLTDLPESGSELHQKTFTFGLEDRWGWSPSYDGRYFLGDLRDILTRAYGKRTYPNPAARSKATA